MTNPLVSVADEILRLSTLKDRRLTPMKLMKLSYISFGWYIANYNVRLYPERIEAWRYGPVMPVLYYEYKKWGRSPIDYTVSDKENSISDNIKDFLKLVEEEYGRFSGVQLSALTHQKGSPWHQVYKTDVPGIEIPEQIIYKYYKTQLDAYITST